MDHLQELLSSKSKEMQILSERVHKSMSSEMLALQIEPTEMENGKVIFMACVLWTFLLFLTVYFSCFCNNPYELFLRLKYFLA